MGSIAAKEVSEKCVICGYERAVERCHIYPTRVIQKMIPMDGFNTTRKIRSRSKGNHIMILCPNCHWNYDHFQLTKNEFDKIKDRVARGLIEIEGVLKYYKDNSIIPNGFLKEFNLWNKKLTAVIEKFYAC